MNNAASVLAFVQVAEQIVNSIVQVNQLWEQVKDLPDEVRDMLSDMEAVGSLFEDIEEQLALDGPSSFRNEASVRRSMVLTRRAYDTLHSLVTDMTSQIKTKKGLKGKVKLAKVVIKKDSLERYRQRLSRSFELLQVSIQAYQMALTRRSPELISRRVTSDLISYLDGNQATKSSTITSVKSIKEAESDVEEIKRTPPVPGNDHLNAEPIMDAVSRKTFTPSKLGRFVLSHAQGKRGWQAHLQWPSWLSQSVYEITSRPSLSGWTYSYRIYNVVPSNADVIVKIRNGDKDGVLDLFSTRQASPFDRDHFGRSLLHYAVSSKNYEICTLLLGMGLREVLTESNDKHYGGIFSEIVFQSDRRNRQREGTNSQDHWKRLAELFQSYLDDPESTMNLRMLNYFQDWASTDDFVLVFRRRFIPKYYKGPLRNRLEAFRYGSFMMQTPENLLSLLCESREITESDVQLSTHEKLSLVHSVAVMLGIRYADEVLPYERLWGQRRLYTDEYSQIVRLVASISGIEDLHSIETVSPWDIHQVPIWRSTPLLSVIGGVLCYLSPEISIRHWDKVFQDTLRKWVSDLQAAGVDLVAYGQREAQTLRSQTGGALDGDAIDSSRHMIRNKISPDVPVMKGPRVEHDSFSENDWIPVRMIDLEFGSNPDDWRLLWAPEFEWMACQFWGLVEEENVVMPGSWVDA